MCEKVRQTEKRFKRKLFKLMRYQTTQKTTADNKNNNNCRMVIKASNAFEFACICAPVHMQRPSCKTKAIKACQLCAKCG